MICDRGTVIDYQLSGDHKGAPTWSLTSEPTAFRQAQGKLGRGSSKFQLA